MSVREAGRKGGKTTRARYGAEFFQEIGAKGGKAVSERYSNEHFREIGRKGGRRVAELIARAKPGLFAQSGVEEGPVEYANVDLGDEVQVGGRPHGLADQRPHLALGAEHSDLDHRAVPSFRLVRRRWRP